MGAPLRHDPAGDRRLKPTMRSRKLQALDFIKRYYAQWGRSPSLSEIGAELGVTKQRVSSLVAQLSAERQIEVTSGRTRGIKLIEQGEQLSEADILVRLAQLGWTVDLAARVYGQPLTEKRLPELPFLDHND